MMMSLAIAGLLVTPYATPQNGSPLAKTAHTTEEKKKIVFEVASLRPGEPPKGDPGLPSATPTGDPGITPDGFIVTMSLRDFIMYAYAREDPMTWIGGHGATRLQQNAPAWLGDLYHLDARVSDDDRDAWSHQRKYQGEFVSSALKALLKDRCKLVIHEQPTEISGLWLVVKKNGPKLTATAPDAAIPEHGRQLGSGGVAVWDERERGWHYHGATMADLAAELTGTSHSMVRDMTGLTGHYDFFFRLKPYTWHEEDMFENNFPIDPLGLELKEGKVQGVTLVIDHIEKPSEN
jgi:uncharacterized protein (TIGR03435 family)